MKLYTKTGDKGKTQVYLKQALRVDKDDLLLQCYGSLDECNAHTGLLQCHVEDTEIRQQLTVIQQTLFNIGFVFSAEQSLSQTQISELESHIDHFQQHLPAQTAFELPGGCIAAAQAHVCRTAIRRAERCLVSLHKKQAVPELCLAYINRLSDYFFILARWLNFQQGITPTTL